MTWDEENNQAIETCFKGVFTVPYKPGRLNQSLELFVTSTCNKKCEYCYLVKYEEQLYPQEVNSPKIILHNLQLLSKYLLENKIPLHNIDIFSGEIWHTDFGISILREVLELCKSTQVEVVMIPSNFTFLKYPEYTKHIESLIEAFAYYGTILLFSCSVDGKYLDSTTRPLKGRSAKHQSDELDEFYKKLFPFCKQHGYGFHPMVSAFSIEHWKDNYEWWIQQLSEYEFDAQNGIMFLEVRNNDWTLEKITSYLEFLASAYDTKLKHFHNGDIERMVSIMIGLSRDGNNYELFSIGDSNCRGSGCSLDRMACVRLGDLAWVPCHRTGYDKFVFGNFIVEDDKITGMRANNLPLLLSVGTSGYKGRMKCDNCPIGPVCMRGCIGSQFETTKELFYPCPTVCDLFIAKTLFIYHKALKESQALNNEAITQKLESLNSDIISKISQEDLDKWMPIINNLI